MRRSAWTIGATVLAALSLGVAACGGSDNSSSGDNKTNTGTQVPEKAKTGGKLTVLWTGDVDFIDCGQTYYQMGKFICNATQKPLYSYKPDNGTDMVPDLADGDPQVSEDGKTVTVKIKQGVKFSPPYDKEVTSADVKYAIERGFFSSVASGFTQTYYADLDGAKVNSKPGTEIKGLDASDPTQLVLHFKRPVGGVMASGALAWSSTAPVPKAYAAKFDAKTPSTYGANQLATGPYMIENDPSGKAIGYDPGKRIHLVRNPSWDKSLDYKPAYLDEIDNLEGNDDPGVASRRILTGQSMVNGDFSPLPENLKDASQNRKSQLKLVPSGGGRWIAMNTKVKPFDDINVRKAVVAGFDRNALILTRGGKLVGDPATHIMAPGMAGFEEAGGMKGTGVDFISPDGSALPDVSAEYFKKAGYASGKYEGKEKILMVGSNAGVAAKTAESAKEQLEKMGFNIEMRLVQQQTMYTRYCNTPSAKVAICPNVGWLKDFADGQTMLDPTFNGKNILQQGNSNWPQLDDPTINKAMDDAELLPKEQRPAAWAAIDKQVTEQAGVVPWIWDKQPLIESANVNGVASEDNAQWELAWSSLK
jgi:peptide/nickel transport system substrate-binding protein